VSLNQQFTVRGLIRRKVKIGTLMAWTGADFNEKSPVDRRGFFGGYHEKRR